MNRSKKNNTVNEIVNIFNQRKEFMLSLAPEGTRQKVSKFKTGFYYIALKANVPICLGYLDYDKKIGGIGKVIHPSGDIDKDMAEIMEFFSQFKGKYPEKFSLDKRFSKIGH